MVRRWLYPGRWLCPRRWLYPRAPLAVFVQLGSPYVSGRTRHWLKFKNPAVPAVKREAEEEWDELFVYNRYSHLDI